MEVSARPKADASMTRPEPGVVKKSYKLHVLRETHSQTPGIPQIKHSHTCFHKRLVLLKNHEGTRKICRRKSANRKIVQYIL